ncbi:hypothetical protein HZA96_03180 [Candidatus Woesearchaeota archaeon]|nr:hypothetical protein [Candidatus Woesearchaeota archaeon]
MQEERLKRIFSLLFLLLVSIFMFGILVAAAEEDEEEEVVIEAPKAGITPDSPFYFIDEIVEEVKLATKEGDEKVEYALEIAKEKAAEAQQMAAENNTAALTIALVNAKNISALIEEEISPDLKKQVEADSKEIQDILKQLQEQLPDEEKIQQLYNSLSNQVEKNKLAGELADKIVNLCEQLARIDYALMEQEEKCNPDTAPAWLKDYIETDIRKLQEEATNKLAEVLKSCIGDIQNCQCQDIPIQKMKTYCEKDKKLVILCELEDNEEACQELDSEGQYAGEELLPEFMREKFRQIMDEEEEQMFEKFAPKECIEAGAKTKEDCKKIMIEKHGEPPEECMENGRFIGEKKCTKKMIESGKMPDECVADDRFIGEEQCIQKMKEAGKIPEQCFDGDKFIGREECEQKMMDSGDIPEECIEDGRPIGENACLEKMKEAGKIPKECFDGDDFIGREACEEKMMAEGNIPEECIEGGRPISEKECTAKMRDAGKIPKECFDGDDFIGREACEEKFKNQMQGERGEGKAPQECMKDNEFIGKEECETIMKEKYQQGEGYGQGFSEGEFSEGDFPDMKNGGPDNKGGAPQECIKDGEFIGMEACKEMSTQKITEEIGQGKYQEMYEEKREEAVGGVIRKVDIPTMPQGFPIGENYGQQQHEQQRFNFIGDLQRMQKEGRINIGDRSFESLSPEEIKQLLHDAEQGSKEAADFTDVQRLQKEIEKLERDREYIDSGREKDNRDMRRDYQDNDEQRGYNQQEKEDQDNSENNEQQDNQNDSENKDNSGDDSQEQGSKEENN